MAPSQRFSDRPEPDLSIEIGHRWSRDEGTKPRIWATASVQDDWLAIYRFDIQDGSPVITELHVVPRPRTNRDYKELLKRLEEVAADNAPSGGLTARALHGPRGLHPGLARSGVQDTLREEPQLARYAAALHGVDIDALNTLRGRGRRGNEDRFYAHMAKEYVDRLGARAPIQALAEAKGYDPAYVSDVIHKARRKGLLTAPPPGRAGGELTEKAIALLRDQAREDI